MHQTLSKKKIKGGGERCQSSVKLHKMPLCHGHYFLPAEVGDRGSSGSVLSRSWGQQWVLQFASLGQASRLALASSGAPQG